MVSSHHFLYQTADERINNLIAARKRYSDFSKPQNKNGPKERAKLRSKMQENQEEILKITNELEECRRELRKMMKNIGRAHTEAIFREKEEDIVDELIKQRNNRVKSRAELVLLEEIHRLKLQDLKRQLEKEKMLKKRRDIYRMRSPAPKVRINREHQEKLNEWKILEDVLQTEINQLKKDKELARTKNLESNSVKMMRQPKLDSKCNPKSTVDTKKKNEKDVQTDPCEDRSKIKTIHRVSESIQVDSSLLSLNVPKPFKEVNMRLENLLTLRVAEKVGKLLNKEPVVVIKNTKDVGINTTVVKEPCNLSQTLYLSLPKEKNVSSHRNERDQRPESTDENDEKTSTDDLSLLNDISNINLEELVKKVQQIKNLVNHGHSEVSSKTINVTVDSNTSPHEDTIEENAVVRDETSSDQQINRGNKTYNKCPISPVSTIRSLSPLSQQTLPSLSSSSPCLNTFGKTITIDNPRISSCDLSLSADDLSLSLEQGRLDDDDSLTSASQDLSFDSLKFSNILNSKKDTSWTSAMDLTSIKKSVTFCKTPVRQRAGRYIQSTPKAY